MRARDGFSLGEIAGLPSLLPEIARGLDSRGRALLFLFRARPKPHENSADPLRDIWQNIIETVATRVKDFSFSTNNHTENFTLEIGADKITHEELVRLLSRIQSPACVCTISGTESGLKVQVSRQANSSFRDQAVAIAS